MRNINEAIHLSYIFCFVLVALKFDGGGGIDALPAWSILMVSTLPVAVYGLTNAVMFTLGRLAYFFRSR